MRIARACPEWTEHNVSDPGITLIELFAWMTEMTIYRLNRVPDKLHVALLELLGIRLDGPSAATTSLRFRLADDAGRADPDPGGATEVGTPRTADRGVGDLPGRRGLHDPRDAPRGLRAAAPRPGQGRRLCRRRGAAAGRRPARVRLAAAGRRRAVPRLRGAARPAADADRRRRLAGPRRGREPRGPAAALGGLPGRRRVGAGRRARGPHRRLQLRLRHGGARAAAALGGRRRSAGTACTGCAAASPRRPRPDARAPPTSTRRRSTRSPPRRWARGCPPRTRRARSARSSASSDGTPGQVFPLRHCPVLKP